MTGVNIQPPVVKDILTGIFFCMLIILIMHILPVIGIFVWVLLPMPVLFYRLKAGRVGGAIIMAVCLGGLILFTGNFAFNLLYFGFFLLTGFFLGEFMERLMSIEKIMLYTCGVVFSITTLIFFLYAASQNLEVSGLIAEYISSYKAFSSSFFNDTAGLYSQVEVDVQRLENINEIFVRILPAVFINSYLTMMWLNILYMKRLLAKKGIVIESLKNLKKWKAPDALVAAVIISGVFCFLPSVAIKPIAQNCLFVLLFVYLLQGIAVASFYFDKKQAPYILRFFFYALIAVQPLFMLLVIGFGLSDTWFNFRKLDADA